MDTAKSVAELEHKLPSLSFVFKSAYRAYTPQKAEKPKPVKYEPQGIVSVDRPLPAATEATRQRAAASLTQKPSTILDSAREDGRETLG